MMNVYNKSKTGPKARQKKGKKKGKVIDLRCPKFGSCEDAALVAK
jgi:hypothetical protein